MCGLCEVSVSEVKITVGGDFEADISRRFVDAWRRAERGSALRRDYRNVHSDVKALAAEGLIDTDGGRLRADYDGAPA